MDARLKDEYTAAARFDYIKLRWRYWSVEFAEEVRDKVYAAWVHVGAENDVAAIKEPRFTVLDPSPNKPDGMFIVELFGLAAEAVHHLDAAWLQYVTYAHVKAFAHGLTSQDLRKLQELYLYRTGRRSATLINGGKAGRSKKGVAQPGIRIGSRKSDWHGVIYARQGFVPGFEGRFRDEGVYQRTLAALDFWNHGEQPDKAAWSLLLRSLARESAVCFETDAMVRGFEIEDFVERFAGWGRATSEQLGLDMEAGDEVIDLPEPVDLNDLYRD